MTYDLPTPSATSPSGFTAYWGGESWYVKVLPDPHTGQPRIVERAPHVGGAETFDAAREYALALLAATKLCRARAF